jgi:hypothetical protein
MVQAGRLDVGEHARRHISGPAVVAQRALWPAAACVLLGQLGRHRGDVVGVQQLQALRHAPVQQPSPRPADLVVGCVAQQVVREVVALAVLTQDPVPPQLVHGLHHVVVAQPARLGKQI